MDQQTYLKEITKAVSFFWKSKQKQLATSVDKSNRGAVVGGKQMDGFISLLKKVAENSGVPRSCIYTKNNYLPGFFSLIQKLGFPSDFAIKKIDCSHRAKIADWLIR